MNKEGSKWRKECNSRVCFWGKERGGKGERCKETMQNQSPVTGKVSSRAMDCKHHTVQISPSAPIFQLQKLVLEILLAWQKRPLFPIFHISYTAHWKASSASVMAWHIYERCIEEPINWKICLSSAFWKSLCTMWFSLINYNDLLHYAINEYLQISPAAYVINLNICTTELQWSCFFNVHTNVFQ